MKEFKDTQNIDNGRHELSDSNGRRFNRSAYVYREKNFYRLVCYSKELATVDRKTKKKSIMVDRPSPVTKKQINEFFNQYGDKEG